MNELISIIIPVYNVEGYIGKCIESLKAQTYKRWEAVLVDDGSTDGSGKICDELASDGRVRVFHKKNGGVSSARNLGLDHACGTIIGFCDPDDFLEPKMLERMMKVLEASENADAVFCGYAQVFEENGLVKPHETAYTGVVDGIEAIRRCYDERGYFTSVWNKLFRRKLIWHDGGPYYFNTEFSIGEDEYWLANLLQHAAKVAMTPEPFYMWLQRKGSAVNSLEVGKGWITAVKSKKAAAESLEAYPALSDMAKAKTYETMYQCIWKTYCTGETAKNRHFKDALKDYRGIFFKSKDQPVYRKIKHRVIDMMMMLHMPKGMVLSIAGVNKAKLKERDVI